MPTSVEVQFGMAALGLALRAKAGRASAGEVLALHDRAARDLPGDAAAQAAVAAFAGTVADNPVAAGEGLWRWLMIWRAPSPVAPAWAARADLA